MENDLILELRKLLDENDVRKILVDELGEGSLQIIQYFMNSPVDKAFTDDQIARDLNMPVKEVREVLNQMYNYGITMYEKHSDVRPGWYEFYWKPDLQELIIWIRKNTYDKLETLKNRLALGEELYYCKNCSSRFDLKVYDFEKAMNLHYRCEVCNGNLMLLDEDIVINYERSGEDDK
ncbi:MAG: hypothetical protein QW336_00555 [Candidatus Anstonellales archaeon]